MRSDYTPYEYVNKANELMKQMILDFPRKKEEKVLLLINSAETYPNMSTYQIMQARIFLIDLYISHKIYGNAYDLCLKTLEAYPKASVKNKIKKLEKIREESPDDFIYSCDVNIVDIELCYINEPNLAEYDPEWEAEIEERLNKLDDFYKKEFYRLRRPSEKDTTLSTRQLEELTLIAMEKTYAYYENK